MNNIIFIETTDNFPYKFTANNSKVKLLANGLIKAGNKVQIINNLRGSEISSIPYTKGNDQNIQYFTFPLYSTQRFGIFKNLYQQGKILKTLKRENEKNIIIMGQPYLLLFLIEVIRYRFMGFKIGVTKTEWPSDIKTIKGLKRLDYIISDKIFGYFIDFIFPISSFIEEKCKKFHKPMFRIPILASFPPYNTKILPKKYFLLCSTLAYMENIKLAIDSFNIFQQKSNISYRLKLILSGNKSQIDNIQKYINTYPNLNIDIYQQIPYITLLKLYSEAEGLLIPLQNTNQDKARFSQKIAEYISTGRPIITNNVGDIQIYFKHKVNAYIAESYDKKTFSEIMKDISLNPEEATQIGKQGYLTGVEYFDNINFGQKLNTFLHSQFI